MIWRRTAWLRALALVVATVAGAAAASAQALPHNIPDFSLDLSRLTVRSVRSGAWGDPGTWQSGQVPTANHVAHVDPNHVVTIDSQNAVAYTVAVHGTLRFSPSAHTRLVVTNLMIMGDHGMPQMTTVGHLEIGTAAAPIAADRTAELVLANTPLGGGVLDPEQFGNGIINFGKLTIHGAVKTPTFTRVAVEPRAKHTTLTLSEPATGWRVGDRLVLPDTRHIKESETVSGGWVNLQNQWEELTVQSISSDGLTVTLTSPLLYDHLGARNFSNVLEFLPHVGNLSRNVIVRSESAIGTRGHFIAVHAAETDIRYATFRDLGRTTYKPLNTTTNLIGRYPVHMHHNRGPAVTPANGYQFTLIGNAVDGGSVETQFKWGIAIHNSHYGLIQDNVVYNYNGASIATEDGSESYNVFDHNFTIRGMGEPNNAVSEARSAMGTEGVGFWFRGANNYVRNNVAANFQNPTAEAAYGYVYQFIRLGNVAIPNFKGADTAVSGQFTTRNGNNMAILQFENNEVYGATQGGLTYWWVSSQDPQPSSNASVSLMKDVKIWHIYNKAIYHYPSQKLTFDGLIIRGNYSSQSRCCGDGFWFEDYSAKDMVIRNSDIQGMEMGIKGPSAGFGPEPNLRIENTVLRNWTNLGVPTPSSVNGCWMQNKLIEVHSTQFLAPPGRSLSAVNMSGAASGTECLSKLNEVRIYGFNGDAADNFQLYHPSGSVQPRPPTSCTQVTRTGFNGPTCVIAPSQSGIPTITFTASPTTIAGGSVSTLSWNTTNATTVTISQGIGTVAASGTRNVTPTQTTSYTLTATNAAGSATANVTVTVAALPTASLTASPSPINSGSSSVLTWSTSNATTVSIDQGIGSVAATGTRNVSPTATTTYTLTASGPGGTVTTTATVVVNVAPLPTATLSASPGTIVTHAASTLSWSTTNATSVVISGGIGTVAASGTRSVSPATTTTYVLTATNAAGSVTSSATVTVQSGTGTVFSSVDLTAGWATFGQVVPQGIAVNGLAVHDLPTQTDVKNRWPDGSIRFAVVTVQVPASGSYPVRSSSASTGSFAAAAVAGDVTLVIGGTTYTAAIPSAASSDLWLSGPLVREDRQVVAPVSTGGAHPFLRVNFDRRVYADGAARVDVSVENTLDIATATTVTYDVSITLNGATLFSKSAVQHYYLTRWRKVFSAGTIAEVTPDLTPFHTARALPPYLSLVTNVVSAPTGAAYDILKSGALIANMPEHGGRPELAPFPDWTARYLVHRNPTQRQFVLANGDLSGSWPIHVREPAGGAHSGVGQERYVSLNQRPNIWFDIRAKNAGFDHVKGTPLPMREYDTTIPGPGQTALIPDNAHQPSLAYVPYLLTGDRYYAEEMAFWANYAMLRTYNADGVRSSAGILQANEVRGYGWALRNLVDAAAYYPDSSPMRAYLAEKVTNNLNWLDQYANSLNASSNPFKIMWLNLRPEGAQYIALWEQNYLAYAIDRAFQQGFTGGLAHRDAIARFQLALFDNDPAYPKAQAAPYVVGVGVPSGNSFSYHTSMSSIWAATQGHTRPFAGYYGPEARLNLMIGVANNWPGADQAYSYLWPAIAVQPEWGSVPDLGHRAGWALDFYPSSTTPASVLTISNVTVNEGQSGTTVATFTVTLSPVNASQTVTVDYSTANGSASAGTDYVAKSGTLTFTPSAASRTITVTVNGDTTTEPDETFLVNLSNATNAVIGDAQGIGTITNDDTAPPTLTVAATTVTAGGVISVTVNGGPGAASDWLALSAATAPDSVYLAWKYLNGLQTLPASGMSSATVQFTAPATPGTYNIRFYAANGMTKLATSPTVTVTAAAPASSLSIADVTLAEGNNGTVAATFTVTLAPVNASQTVTVNYATANGTATAGSDYTAASGTLTFAPSVGTQTLTVTVSGDTTHEPNETFLVNLTNATNAVIGDGQATGTITNDDAAPGPTLTLASTTVTAGGAIAVTVSGGPGAVSDWLALGATTAPDTVYLEWKYLNGLHTMPASGLTGATVQFTAPATPGTYNVRFFAADSYTKLATSATITVTAAAPASSLSIADVTLAEGNNGTVNATFTVTLSPVNASQTVTVNYATANGTATAGSDYSAASGTLTFNPSVATQTLTVTVSGDTTHEPNETFFVNLSNATNAVIGDGQATGTITNDDAAAGPTLTLASTTVTAGGAIAVTVNGGPGAVSDWLALGATTAPDTVYLEWKYLNGLHTLPASGVSSATVQFTAPATPGTYNVRFFAADSYTKLATSATITVTAAAPASSLSIADVTLAEGNNGTVNATFTVTLAPVNASQTVTVNYATANGTATAGSDYAAASGTLTFNPSVATQTVTVTVTGDTTVEPNETFFVNLTNATNAVIGTGQATGTITNDDAAAGPTLTLASTSVTVGSVIAVTVSGGPGAASDWLALGAVTAPDTVYLDWKYLNGLHTLPASGLTGATVQFTAPATPGTYNIRFFAANGYTKLATSATITVTAAAATPTLSIADVTVVEGNSGTVAATFTVTLSPVNASQTVTVNYATANGTATAGSDYTAASGTLTFNPSVGTQTVTVTVTGDTVFEPNETFVVNLTNATNAVIGDGQATGTITNDEAASGPTLTLASTTVAVGGVIAVTVSGGPFAATDWLALSVPSAADTVYVDWKYLNGLRATPSNGVMGATVQFIAPTTPGSYHLRLFADNGYTRLATSATITVTTTSVSVASPTVTAGGVIHLTVNGGPGNALDWVALVPVSAGDSAYVDWQFLNGTRSAPAAGVTSASLQFAAPATPGTYDIRFFANNSYMKLATSVAITVTAP